MLKEKSYKLEACVDTYDDAQKALVNGADQMELCSSLELDGLSPTIALTSACLSDVTIPVKVMIRMRSGNFVYSSSEMIQMLEAIKRFQGIGVSHFVIGMLTSQNEVDLKFLERCRNICQEATICFHKAIDSTANIVASAKVLMDSGLVQSILTSGGATTAWKGKHNLLKMKELSDNRVEIIGAGSIRYDNLNQHHQYLGLTCYHGRKIVNLSQPSS